MPIYEFVCKKCGHAFERYLDFAQAKTGCTPSCTLCNSNKTERIVSVSTWRIKGFNEKNGYSNAGGKT